MKKIVVLFSVISFLLLPVTAAHAQNATRLRVDVPFSFIADNAELPAGAYAVEHTPSHIAGGFSSIKIRNRNGELAAFMFMRQLPDRNVKSGAVQFTKYGRTYVLSAVASDGGLSVIRNSKAERDKLARHKAQVTTIAAVN